MANARRVVITGMGVVTSLGDNIDRFWGALCAGQSGVGELTLFDTTEFRVHFGGQVRDWDPAARFGVKDARHLDRFAQFALAAAITAVADSGVDFSKLPAENCGVFIGSGIGGLSEFESQHLIMMQKGPSRISPFVIPKLMVNAASGQVSIRWGLTGPCSAVATACASAANAIGDAYRLIQAEHADLIITGGSEAAITHMGLGGFASMRALSTRNDDPTRASRPFDRDRDGFRPQRRCGYSDPGSRRNRAPPRSENLRRATGLRGCARRRVAHHASRRRGAGAMRAHERVLERRRALAAEDVHYIKAHGTSTPAGDLAETRAMKRVFGHHAAKLQISSTKSQLGHTLGASGGIELIISALAIHNGVLPPTINLEHPGEGCDLDYIPNVAREARVDTVMSNSFGFGGHNASLLIRRYSAA